LRQLEEVLYVIPVGQSHGQKQLFAFFRGQRSRSGNASGKAGLIHGIEYGQKKAPINVIKTNQAYWPIRFCGFIHAQLWVALIPIILQSFYSP